ncbi:MAG TPA: Ig-like domain-containing protein [Longimicrobiales bacterium]|nr:Ig-like domain-containing protein [Longimicrobiales bacterium]
MMRFHWTTAFTAAAALALGCGGDGTGPGRGDLRVIIAPADTLVTALGDSVHLSASVVERNGRNSPSATVIWTSLDPEVVSVGETGVAVARSNGAARIRALAGTAADTAIVRVRQQVVGVGISAPDTVLPLGSTTQLGGGGVDARGNVVADQPVEWVSSDPAIAAVDAEGVVNTRSTGAVTVRAQVGTEQDSISLQIVRPAANISISTWHACATDLDGSLYCWGSTYGELLGRFSSPEAPVPLRVPTPAPFGAVATSSRGSCALSSAGEAYCWGYPTFGVFTPTLDRGPEPLEVLSVSQTHACGVGASGQAYCWGINFYGAFGNGQPIGASSTLVPVATNVRFRTIAALASRTCALTSEGRAYCWGYNEDGALGGGFTSQMELLPVRVVTDLSFASIAAGDLHVCALTGEGAAYCWGSNEFGQLGNGSTANVVDHPVAVRGGVRFASISPGNDHTCGLDAEGRAYCWGSNGAGQLGIGSHEDRMQPTPVAGGLRFRAIAAGDGRTCGITTRRVAYCWGSDNQTPIGIGWRPDGDVTVPTRILLR